ncbi:MAG: hypothetical protein E6713_10785 [Sporomusaceae bacterium]|nr:hypothetical protein [Sporomusaceae bacterium]
MERCPACGKKAIGKVGVDQYYCWECCVEFVFQDDHYEIFTIDDDGALVAQTTEG